MKHIKKFNEEREYRGTNEPNPVEENTISSYISKHKGKSKYELYHELRNLGFEGTEIIQYLDEREM